MKTEAIWNSADDERGDFIIFHRFQQIDLNGDHPKILVSISIEYSTFFGSGLPDDDGFDTIDAFEDAAADFFDQTDGYEVFWICTGKGKLTWLLTSDYAQAPPFSYPAAQVHLNSADESKQWIAQYQSLLADWNNNLLTTGE